MQLDHADLLAVAAILEPGTDARATKAKMRKLLPPQFLFALFSVESIPRNAMGRVPRQAFARDLAKRLTRNDGAKPTPQ